MANLTLMFPNENGIELTITFEQDKQFSEGVELQMVCLAGENTDFSQWLNESAIAVIERLITQENDSLYLCRVAVEYEDAA
jgi:hypothetical protein